MQRGLFGILGLAIVAGCGSSGGKSDPGDTVVDQPEDETIDSFVPDTTEEEPAGEVECAADGDCNDDDPCTADTCDADGDCVHSPVDADGDGVPAAEVDGVDCGGADCDDWSAVIYPGAPVICENTDRNCSGHPDYDEDEDGHLNAEICELTGDDCDDENAGAHPDIVPDCEAFDADCDGRIENDLDGDGHISTECGGEDCNDLSTSIYEGADEVCRDGVDQDCDGIVDGLIPMGPDVVASGSSTNGRFPAMAWTGSEFGIAYEDNITGHTEIHIRRMSADGSPVGDSLPLTDHSEGGAGVSAAITWTGSEFGIAWTDGRDGQGEIYFVRVNSIGNKIGVESRITNTTASPEGVSVAWTGSEFGLIWGEERSGGDEQVYFSRVNIIGDKVGSDFAVTSDAVYSSGYSMDTALAWNGVNYAVSWTDDRVDDDGDIYFLLLSPTGTRSTSDIRLTDLTSGDRGQSVVWTGSEFGVGWYNDGSGDEIYFVRVSSTGDIVSSSIRITNDSSQSNDTTLAWTGSQFAFKWADLREGNHEIFMTLTDPIGTKVGSDVRITNDPGFSHRSDMAWTGSEFGIAWEDTRSATKVWFNHVGLCD